MMKKTAGGKLEARDLSKAYGSGRFAKTVVGRR
jgi:hypothetical protein